MMRRRLYEELGFTSDLREIPAVMAEIYCLISTEIQDWNEKKKDRSKGRVKRNG